MNGIDPKFCTDPTFQDEVAAAIIKLRSVFIKYNYDPSAMLAVDRHAFDSIRHNTPYHSKLVPWEYQTVKLGGACIMRQDDVQVKMGIVLGDA